MSGRNGSAAVAAPALGGGSGPLVLQPAWDALRAHGPLLQGPFFGALFSVATYLGCCAPFVLLDALLPRLPALRRYKLQPDFSPSARQLLPCVARTLYQHAVFVLPLTLLPWAGRPAVLPAAAPELPQLLRHVALCLLLFDAEFFAWHVLHHRVGWLYRAFHKVHHQHAASFALATQYMSAWELLWLGFFDVLNTQLLACHPLTVLVFHVVNIWLSVEDHSGYDFPWSTHRLVPFGWFGGAAHHDLHHARFHCNFAPYFTHWDKVLGTLVAAREDAPGRPDGEAPKAQDAAAAARERRDARQERVT